MEIESNKIIHKYNKTKRDMNEHSAALEAMITDFCTPNGVINPNTAVFGKPKEDRFTHPTD